MAQKSEVKDWAFQKTAKARVYQSLRVNQSCIMMMPTGAGKTNTAQDIIKDGLKHNRRVAFVVDRLSLLDQTVDRFLDAGIHTGVIQGTTPMNPAARVQVCSVQTLAARDQWPECNLVVVDECHSQYAEVYQAMADHPDVKFLGLTATPFTTGLGRHWQDLVVTTTTRELIMQGYLSRYIAYGPATPDLHGVKTSNGDYTKSQLDKPVAEIFGKVIEQYQLLGENRKALGFTVNVAHAKELAAIFNARGIPADYVEGRDTEERRRDVLARFKSNEIRVLFSCEVMIKGMDYPDVQCLLVARPTKSLSLHIQMLGRGLRFHPDKDYCLILDFAGNLERLGYPDDDLPQELCTKEKGVSSVDRREKKEPKPWNCPKCTYLNPEGTMECGLCGHVRARPSRVNEREARLVRLTGQANVSRQETYSQLLMIAENRGHSHGWAAHKFRELWDQWPNGLHKGLAQPTPKLLSWVKSQQIRYAKGVARGQ